MSAYGFLSFTAILLCLGAIEANMSHEDRAIIKAALHPFMMKCAEEYGITEEQLEKAKKKGNPAGIDPCFLGCVMKKAEFFDDNGMFDVEKSAEFAKTNLKSEKFIKFFDAVAAKCIKVNDEEVSDGEKGCERAKLFFHCLREVKKEHNFEE